MAFDRTNSSDLLALKNEVNNDPLSIGYSSAINVDVILDLLNDPVNNPEGQIGKDYATVNQMLEAIWGESISSQDQFKIQLVFEIANSPNSDITNFKSNIGALSTGLQTAIDAITRPLSRAEVLFSDDILADPVEKVIISQQDWIAARDS